MPRQTSPYLLIFPQWANCAILVLIAVTIVGALQSNGMCITTGRFYSDDEFRQMGINALLEGRHGGTTVCERETLISDSGTCSSGFENKYGLLSLKNYISQNSDCCKVHGGYNDQYGSYANPQPHHYFFGIRYRFFDANWPTTTINVNTNYRSIDISARSFAMSQCGNIRTVQLILEE